MFDKITRSSTLGVLFLLSSASTALATFNCDVHIENVSFNLSALAGTRHINSNVSTPPSTTEYLWVLDPCSVINRDPKEIPDVDQCPEQSQICGIQHVTLPDKDPLLVSVIPVAGDQDGKQNSVHLELLNKVTNNETEGLRVTLKGSKWGNSDNLHGIIDFVCPKESQTEDVKFDSWDLNSLKLTWITKHACENATSIPNDGDKKPDDDKPKDDPPKDGEPAKSNNSWGFFTWVFIIFVLGTAGYVISSAWINYNRYGLSGVDVLPHADILRDIPFLITDLFRKIAGTFSGGSNRGGYSAV